MIRLAVSLGDPAGIGPEVSEKAVAELLRRRDDVSVCLVGPRGIADAMASRLADVNVTAEVQDAFAGPIGLPTVASGRAALDAIHQAIGLAEKGLADALVTAPLSKEALALCGSLDRGHTEILARRLGRGPVAMAFLSPRLRVALATTHIPLRRVFGELQPRRIVDVARLLHRCLETDLGIEKPRLAIAALNPHAGEAGLLGEEELAVLQPAIDALETDHGLRIAGPVAADSVFRQAADGLYDGVVALYHDQALIPVKLVSFGSAVNVTLGLSVPRTSPDHGTAYDLAGLGKADPSGMLQALLTAADLVLARQRGLTSAAGTGARGTTAGLGV